MARGHDFLGGLVPIGGEHGPGPRHASVRLCIVGIQIGGLHEVGNGQPEAFRGELVPFVVGAQVKIESGRIVGLLFGNAGGLTLIEAQAQLLGNAGGDLRVDSLKLGGGANEPVAPDLRSIQGVDQFHLNHEGITLAREPRAYDRGDAQLLAGFQRIAGPHLERSRARGDLEIGARQAIDQAFGDAVGQIVVAGVAGGIFKRQHGEGIEFRAAAPSPPGSSAEGGGKRDSRARTEQSSPAGRGLHRGRDDGGLRQGQRGRDFLRVVEALLARLPEASVDDARQRLRQRVGGGRRRIAQNRRQTVLSTGFRKRAPARRHLVENAAQRKKITAVIDFFAAHLLGGHVADGAHQQARLGHEADGQGFLATVFRRGIGELGESEVEHLHVAIGGHHHVRGFQIAMNDSGRMGGGERRGDLRAAAHHFGSGQSIGRNALFERLAGDQLHDQEVDAIGFGDIVQHDDVGMIQSGDGAGFLKEAALAVRVGHAAMGQDLDSDGAPEPRVTGAVDFAHASGAERRFDFVGSQPFSRFHVFLISHQFKTEYSGG